jgi:superfamily II DNA or RNA helicase
MENKIEVRQTSIVVNDYHYGDCSRLESFFIIQDPVNYSLNFKCAKYDPEKCILYLPRGIDIWYVENQVKAKATFAKTDDFMKTSDTMIKTLPRDDRQSEALRFILGNKEYSWTNDYSQKLIACPTGFGKTYITIAAVAYLSVPAIIITSSVEWLNQWKVRIQEYTDITKKQICHITGTSDIHKLLNNPKLIDRYKIYLVSHQTLETYAKNTSWESIGELFRFLKLCIKIYDEAHLNFDNMCKIDYASNTYLTLYLTATPARSDKDENALYKLYFKNVPKLDMFDEDLDPRTEYIAMFYNSEPTPKDMKFCSNRIYGIDRNKYTNYVVKQENFQNMLMILMHHIRTEVDGKVLVYIGTNDAIKYVYDWIMENCPDFYGRVGIFTSVSDKSTKQEQLEKDVILSTTKSCGAAMDIKGLKETIVLAEPFKSEVIARQTLGRTRDKNTSYRELVDTGFYQTRKYYYAKEPIFEKYATSCSTEKYNDNIIYQKLDEIDRWKQNPKRKSKRPMSPIIFFDD